MNRAQVLERKVNSLEAELVAVRSQLDHVTKLRNNLEMAVRQRTYSNGLISAAYVAQELTLILKANDEPGPEPKYDLTTQQWDKTCPCITAMQLDPECPWHGRDV